MRALEQFITGHRHFVTKCGHNDYCSYHHQCQSMWETAYLKNWIFDNVTVVWLQAVWVDRLNISIMCCKRTNTM